MPKYTPPPTPFLTGRCTIPQVFHVVALPLPLPFPFPPFVFLCTLQVPPSLPLASFTMTNSFCLVHFLRIWCIYVTTQLLSVTFHSLPTILLFFAFSSLSLSPLLHPLALSYLSSPLLDYRLFIHSFIYQFSQSFSHAFILSFIRH